MVKKDILREYKEKRHVLWSEYSEKQKALRDEYKDKIEDFYLVTGIPRPKDPPKRPVLEEVGNAVTHGAGAIFAIIAFILMCVFSDTPTDYIGASMYFFGQFIMFTVSCLYHSFRHGSAVKRLFRRFDYSCIYLLIGATFAPILLSYVDGTFGLVFFIIQWAVIAIGIALIGVFGPSRLRFIHIPLYLVLGWCGLIIVPIMIANGDFAFLWYIIGGGVIYSLGVIPFALNRGPAHFIWHFFVLAGAVVQWIGVFTCIYLP